MAPEEGDAVEAPMLPPKPVAVAGCDAAGRGPTPLPEKRTAVSSRPPPAGGDASVTPVGDGFPKRALETECVVGEGTHFPPASPGSARRCTHPHRDLSRALRSGPSPLHTPGLPDGRLPSWEAVA